MLKPEGYVETNFLTDLKDGHDELYGFVREIYGICYSEVVIDDRTGQIIKIGSKEYEELD